MYCLYLYKGIRSNPLQCQYQCKISLSLVVQYFEIASNYQLQKIWRQPIHLVSGLLCGVAVCVAAVDTILHQGPVSWGTWPRQDHPKIRWHGGPDRKGLELASDAALTTAKIITHQHQQQTPNNRNVENKGGTSVRAKDGRERQLGKIATSDRCLSDIILMLSDFSPILVAIVASSYYCGPTCRYSS